MNVFSRIAKGIKNAIIPAKSVDMQSQELLEWLGISSTPKKLVSEVTYFTCLKMLSETLGKMPLKFRQDTDKGVQRVKSNKVHRLLRTRPNALMTPSIFWATVEQNRNHYGNAYVRITRKLKKHRNGGIDEIQDLWIMPSNDVQVLIDDQGCFGAKGRIWYLYTDKYSTEQYLFNSDDVMHFKTSYSFDGILGVHVR